MVSVRKKGVTITGSIQVWIGLLDREGEIKNVVNSLSEIWAALRVKGGENVFPQR
jgi:muramidase (phage lysozyme)